MITARDLEHQKELKQYRVEFCFFENNDGETNLAIGSLETIGNRLTSCQKNLRYTYRSPFRCSNGHWSAQQIMMEFHTTPCHRQTGKWEHSEHWRRQVLSYNYWRQHYMGQKNRCNFTYHD
jgi:hypothetical protein